MTRIVVVGELAPDGSLTKLSTEVATLARTLGEAAGADVAGMIHGPAGVVGPAAAELGRFVPGVLTDTRVGGEARAVDVAAALSTTVGPDDVVLLPASPNGRDVAGTLSGLSGIAVLANATGARWTDDGPIVEMSAFGGKLITESAFTAGRGIITVRPNAVTAVARDGAPAGVTAVADAPVPPQAAVRLVEQVAQEAAAVSIDDARIIVSGGRGVGSPEGFALVQDLADAARRRRGRHASRRGLGLDPVRPADRPDRQDRQAAALPGAGNQRGDPAQGRDADRRHHRRRQSRSRRPDRGLRRHVRRRRPL